MTDAMPQAGSTAGPDQAGDLTGQILDIVATETNVPRERLGLDVPMDSLGIPSLDLVQAIFALETRFDIEIPVAESQTGSEFATVGDLVSHVRRTIEAKHGGAPQPDGGTAAA